MRTPVLLAAALIASPALVAPAFAADNKIAPMVETVEVLHNGETVIIQRGHDPDAQIPEAFRKTDRGCPPFCIQPMIAAPGVETIGELEMLEYLHRIAQGDDSFLVIDSRTPEWATRGTIPGSVNIPWNTINIDTAGTFETPAEAEGLKHILADEFGAEDKGDGTWDFNEAKTLVLFCNGIWCPQSTANLKTLVDYGYPAHKLKWYRGGMQDWLTAGLTTVKP
jgi:rhodanese-related sulfurtransferase